MVVAVHDIITVVEVVTTGPHQQTRARGGAQPSPAQPSPAQHQCLTSVIAVGTTGIILRAPSLYALRPAIDEYLSEIEVAVAKPRGQNNEIY